jgi:hypothetical protein
VFDGVGRYRITASLHLAAVADRSEIQNSLKEIRVQLAWVRDYL